MSLSGNATNMAASLFGIIPRELLSLHRQSEKVLKASPSAAQNATWVCPLCSKRWLHAFQKKSLVGIKTPKPEIDLISKRIKLLKSELSP